MASTVSQTCQDHDNVLTQDGGKNQEEIANVLTQDGDKDHEEVTDSVAFPCPTCGDDTENTRAIECTDCKEWYHIQCEELEEITFAKHVRDDALGYTCKHCQNHGGDKDLQRSLLFEGIASPAMNSAKETQSHAVHSERNDTENGQNKDIPENADLNMTSTPGGVLPQIFGGGVPLDL